jgi:hypothetical protein
MNVGICCRSVVAVGWTPASGQALAVLRVQSRSDPERRTSFGTRGRGFESPPSPPYQIEIIDLFDATTENPRIELLPGHLPDIMSQDEAEFRTWLVKAQREGRRKRVEEAPPIGMRPDGSIEYILPGQPARSPRSSRGSRPTTTTTSATWTTTTTSCEDSHLLLAYYAPTAFLCPSSISIPRRGV